MDQSVIVLCPGFARTGGPEALHQLVHELNQLADVSAYIYYYGECDPVVIAEYQALYQVHEINHVSMPGASIIFPEPLDPREIPVPPNGSKWVWWLSAERYWPLHFYADCHHLFQSEYARIKFGLLGINGLMLTDYIRDSFSDTQQAGVIKQNAIAFNATKSSAAMLGLAYSGVDALMVPLIQMSSDEIHQALLSSKLYLDFGWHPGRDRLPREAVLNNCMIVTSRDGAADNNVDVPIPDEYKIEFADLAKSANLVMKFLEEYQQRQADFDHYREFVRGQREQFIQEVDVFAQIVKRREERAIKDVSLSIDDELDKFLLMQEKRARAWRSFAVEQALFAFQNTRR